MREGGSACHQWSHGVVHPELCTEAVDSVSAVAGGEGRERVRDMLCSCNDLLRAASYTDAHMHVQPVQQ